MPPLPFYAIMKLSDKLQFVGQFCTAVPKIHVIPRERSDRGNLNKILSNLLDLN